MPINPIEVLKTIDIPDNGIQNILKALNYMNVKQNYINYSKVRFVYFKHFMINQLQSCTSVT